MARQVIIARRGNWKGRVFQRHYVGPADQVQSTIIGRNPSAQVLTVGFGPFGYTELHLESDGTSDFHPSVAVK